MKKIAAIVLLALSTFVSLPAVANKENRAIGENQNEAKRAMKQQQKYTKKQAKRQRKAMKKYQKGQRKSAHHQRRHR